MPDYRVIAIPTAVADSVRATLVSPRCGHPAHVEVARGHGPCRHCLRTFRVGEEERILFTLDAFADLEPLPLPGPVYVHADACARYPEDGGFPADLRTRSFTFNAYSRGRVLKAQEYVRGDDVDAAIAALLARADVAYTHVRDTEAGCYDFRIERAEPTSGATASRSARPAAGVAGEQPDERHVLALDAASHSRLPGTGATRAGAAADSFRASRLVGTP